MTHQFIKTALAGVAGISIMVGCSSHTVVERETTTPARVVIETPPPQTLEERGTPPYPDAVWNPGHYERRGDHWRWVAGSWITASR